MSPLILLACAWAPFLGYAAPLDEVDWTVTEAELEEVRGWKKATKVRTTGSVALVLHVREGGGLFLSLLEDRDGVLRTFRIGEAPDRAHLGADGDAFVGRDNIEGYEGPILFAVRDGDRRIAVWSEGATIKVAEERDGGAWEPRLRLQFPRATTFEAIGTLFPH